MPKIEETATKPKASGAAKARTNAPEPEAVDTKPKVLYPKLAVNGIEIPASALRVTVDQMKKYLGWESEPEFAARMKRLDPDLKDAEVTFAKSDPPVETMLVDENGDRVVCWRNQTNRPFDEATSRKYAQDILTRNWAGPSTMPEETVNGETIIVGRNGRCLSIQHRGVGLILAAQMWEKNKAYWGTRGWEEEPYIETLVVTGVSESQRVVSTLDNVRARTEADTIYTSLIFKDLNTNVERRECSRMLALATDTLWRRTGASETGDKYQTHSASESFRARHPRLQECVRAMFELNKDRVISDLRLYAGACAACLYMMGSSESDIDDYRNMEPAPGEEILNWDMWDRALLMFKGLADVKDSETKAIRSALANLKDDPEKPGRNPEKIAILAKAWRAWKENEKPALANLKLDYARDHNKNLRWIEDEDCMFGGIDLGAGGTPPDPEVPEAEAEQTKEQVRQQKEAELAARAANAKNVGVRVTTQDEAVAQHRARAKAMTGGPVTEVNGEKLPTKVKPGADVPPRAAWKPKDKAEAHAVAKNLATKANAEAAARRVGKK